MSLVAHAIRMNLRQTSSTKCSMLPYTWHRLIRTVAGNMHPTTRTSWIDVLEGTAFVLGVIAVAFLMAGWHAV
jgi:hypothetical protein